MCWETIAQVGAQVVGSKAASESGGGSGGFGQAMSSIANLAGGQGGGPVIGPTAPPPPVLNAQGSAGAMSDLAKQGNFGTPEPDMMGPPAIGNPAGVLPQFDDVLNAEITPVEEIMGEQQKNLGLFGRTFENIDEDLQSPAKLIGVGLLNQRKRGLGTGLLAARGLFNAIRDR